MSTLPRFLADIWGRFRWRAVALVLVMLVNGLMEGLAILLLFPLLSMVGVGVGLGASSNSVAQVAGHIFSILGIGPSLMGVLGLVIGAFVLQNSVFLLQSWLAARQQNDYVAHWRQKLAAAYLHADWPFFLNQRGGHLINSMTNECFRAGGAFYLVVQLASAILVASVYMGIALITAWQATLMIFAAGGLVFVLTHPIIRHSHRTAQRIGDQTAELTHVTSEVFGLVKLVKATAIEPRMIRRIGDLAHDLSRGYFWLSFHPNLLRAIFETVIISALAVMLVICTQVLDMDTATVFLVLAVFVRLYPRVSSLQQNIQLLQSHLPSVDLVRGLHDQAAARAEHRRDDGTASAPTLPPTIELDGLQVDYGDYSALSDVRFTIPSGWTVALVGPSGAGKSTLVDTLLRLTPPTAGRILVDGRPIQDYALGEWRRCVGYLPQETFLFDASIRDNIAWEIPNASRDAVEEAARQAQAHDFIMALPQGYDTPVGERGVRLSGGQRQRLGLARVLLKNARILILDEATSALDADAESAVVKVISSLRGQMSIIIITHRLSTARDADQLFVLERGRLVESGTWSSLTQQDGVFNRLWRSQSEHPQV